MSSAPGTRLRTLARERLPALFVYALRSLEERITNARWPLPAQRLGKQALQRVVARYPVLAELLGRVQTTVPTHDVVAQVAAAKAPPEPAQSATRDASAYSTRPIEALLERLKHADWRERVQAANSVDAGRNAELVEALCWMLRDESADAAAAAALALGKQGGVEAVRELRNVLANGDGYFSPVTRAACVQALAQLGELDPLSIATLVRDRDAEVSLVAIASMSPGLSQRERQALEEVIADSAYFLPIVRLAATNALARRGALGRDAATSWLQTESDPQVRSALEAGIH